MCFRHHPGQFSDAGFALMTFGRPACLPALPLLLAGKVLAFYGFLKVPPPTLAKLKYKDHTKAHLYSFYPGAKLKDPVTVHFEHTDYYEMLRFILFAS
jgi:hypothetical protein